VVEAMWGIPVGADGPLRCSVIGEAISVTGSADIPQQPWFPLPTAMSCCRTAWRFVMARPPTGNTSIRCRMSAACAHGDSTRRAPDHDRHTAASTGVVDAWHNPRHLTLPIGVGQTAERTTRLCAPCLRLDRRPISTHSAIVHDAPCQQCQGSHCPHHRLGPRPRLVSVPGTVSRGFPWPLEATGPRNGSGAHWPCDCASIRKRNSKVWPQHAARARASDED